MPTLVSSSAITPILQSFIVKVKERKIWRVPIGIENRFLSLDIRFGISASGYLTLGDLNKFMKLKSNAKISHPSELYTGQWEFIDVIFVEIYEHYFLFRGRTLFLAKIIVGMDRHDDEWYSQGKIECLEMNTNKKEELTICLKEMRDDLSRIFRVPIFIVGVD